MSEQSDSQGVYLIPLITRNGGQASVCCFAVQFSDVCFGGAPVMEAGEKLDSVFPTMDLHFQARPLR